jgi:hypothetical protein
MNRRDVLRWLGLGVITLVTAPIVVPEIEVVSADFGNRFIQKGLWHGGRPLTYEMLTECFKNVYEAMVREQVNTNHRLYYKLAGELA